MLADYKKYRNNLPGDIDDSGYLMDLDRVTDKFIATRGKKLHGEYEQFYDKSIQYINEKIGSNAKSFKDIISFLTARAKANAMKPVQPPVLPTPPSQALPRTLSVKRPGAGLGVHPLHPIWIQPKKHPSEFQAPRAGYPRPTPR